MYQIQYKGNGIWSRLIYRRQNNHVQLVPQPVCIIFYVCLSAQRIRKNATNMVVGGRTGIIIQETPDVPRVTRYYNIYFMLLFIIWVPLVDSDISYIMT